jgi:RimJ/RimL family protein N-acetyltransferase
MRTEPIAGGRVIIVDNRMLNWIALRIPAMGAGYEWQKASAIGLGHKGKIIAGMAVHNFLPHYKSCELTFASTTPTWATRTSIAAMLAYPFVQLGVRRIMTVIAASNTRAIRVNEHLGFKLEGRCRYGCGDEDALIFGLLREETPAWMNLATNAKIE